MGAPLGFVSEFYPKYTSTMPLVILGPMGDGVGGTHLAQVLRNTVNSKMKILIPEFI